MEHSEKQLQLIETAERLFAEKGFRGTSVRDIADEADVNPAMISYYFGSKVKLMEALFEARVGSVQLRIENLINDDSLEPLQKINMLVDEHIERFLQKERFFRIMITEQLVNKDPAVINTLRQLKIRNAQLLSQLIRKGQKSGAFKKNVDVVLLVNTLVGTVWQTMINRDHYREFNKLGTLTEGALINRLSKKLSIHIKNLFKDILTHEA
jgi:AcrR family transcriptional regulator